MLKHTTLGLFTKRWERSDSNCSIGIKTTSVRYRCAIVVSMVTSIRKKHLYRNYYIMQQKTKV